MNNEILGTPGGATTHAPGIPEADRKISGSFSSTGSNIAWNRVKFNKTSRRFQQALRKLPAPGQGCHSGLLRVVNIGIAERIHPLDIFVAIRGAIKLGTRLVADDEIADAIEKGVQTFGMYVRKTVKKRLRKTTGASNKPELLKEIGAKIYAAILTASPICTEEDIIAMSPISIPSDPIEQAVLLLRNLFLPNEFVFTGDQCTQRVDPVNFTIQNLPAQLNEHPLMIPNPFTGKQARTKSGKLSFRCDAAIANFRIAIAEFDDKPLNEQLRFWKFIIENQGLPVAALIYSGGKSLHGWIAVNCRDQADWNENVKDCLFREILEPLGVDPATKNPSRLSRLPGHFRADKGQYQRLLYLNPNAVRGNGGGGS